MHIIVHWVAEKTGDAIRRWCGTLSWRNEAADLGLMAAVPPLVREAESKASS